MDRVSNIDCSAETEGTALPQAYQRVADVEGPGSPLPAVRNDRQGELPKSAMALDGPPLIFDSKVNGGMGDHIAAAGGEGAGSAAAPSESAKRGAADQAMDVDDASQPKRFRLPTAADVAARKRLMQAQARSRMPSIFLGQNAATSRFGEFESTFTAEDAASERGRDSANGEALSDIPPRDVLQFGPHTVDRDYRDALYEAHPRYTAEEIVGSFLGRNHDFPSQEDWEADQIRARVREEEEGDDEAVANADAAALASEPNPSATAEATSAAAEGGCIERALGALLSGTSPDEYAPSATPRPITVNTAWSYYTQAVAKGEPRSELQRVWRQLVHSDLAGVLTTLREAEDERFSASLTELREAVRGMLPPESPYQTADDSFQQLRFARAALKRLHEPAVESEAMEVDAGGTSEPTPSSEAPSDPLPEPSPEAPPPAPAGAATGLEFMNAVVRNGWCTTEVDAERLPKLGRAHFRPGGEIQFTAQSGGADDAVDHSAVLLLHCKIGTGKSTAIRELWKHELSKTHKRGRVIYVSPRISYALNLAADLRNLFGSAKVYLYKEGLDIEPCHQHICCSQESFHKLAGIDNVTMVVLDELRVLSGVVGGGTLRKPANLESLRRACMKVPYLTAMDADTMIDGGCREYLKYLAPNRRVNHLKLLGQPSHLHRTYTRRWDAVVLEDREKTNPGKDEWMRELKAALEESKTDPEKRVAISIGTRTQKDIIVAMCQSLGLKWETIYGDMTESKKAQLLTDPDTHFAPLNVLIFTSSFSVGVDPQTVKFARLFIWTFNRGGCLFREQVQGVGRFGRQLANALDVTEVWILLGCSPPADVTESLTEREMENGFTEELKRLRRRQARSIGLAAEEADVAGGEAPPALDEGLVRVEAWNRVERYDHHLSKHNKYVLHVLHNAGWEPSDRDAESGSAGELELDPFSTDGLDEEKKFELLAPLAKHRYALVRIAQQGVLNFFDQHELNAANHVKPDWNYEKWMDNVFYALRPVADIRPLFPPALSTITEEELAERIEEAEQAQAWAKEAAQEAKEAAEAADAGATLAAEEVAEAAKEEARELGEFLEEAAKKLKEYMKHNAAMVCNVNARLRPVKEMQVHDHWYGKAHMEWALGGWGKEKMGTRVKLLNQAAKIIGVDSLFEPFTLPEHMLELMQAEDLGTQDEHLDYKSTLEQLRHIMMDPKVGGGQSNGLRHVVTSLVTVAGLVPIIDRPKGPKDDPTYVTRSFVAERRLPQMADAMHVHSSRLNKFVRVCDWAEEHADLDEASAQHVLTEMDTEKPKPLDSQTPLPTNDPLRYRCERYEWAVLKKEYDEAVAKWEVAKKVNRADLTPEKAAEHKRVESEYRWLVRAWILCRPGEDGYVLLDGIYSKHNTIGRRYATYPSRQSCPSTLRVRLGCKVLHDCDLSNCHPTLMLQFVRKLGKDAPVLARYIEHRDAILAEIAAYYGISKPLAKEAVLAILNGGSVYGWRKACEETGAGEPLDKPDFPFLDELSDEWLDTIRPAFFEHTDFKDHIEQLRANVREQQRKEQHPDMRQKVIDRKVLAHCLHELEDRILMVIDDFLRKREWKVESLIFDGLMVVHRDDAILTQDLKLAEAEVERLTSYKIELIEKKFHDPTTADLVEAAVEAS